MTTSPEMITVAAAAERYGVSIATIRRRIKDGTLTPYRLGARTVRLDAAEVDTAFRGAQ